MMHQYLKKSLSVLVALMLVFAFSLPATAFAAKPEVQVDNHTAAGEQKTLTQIRIDDVDAPQAGTPLDDKAQVSSAEGETWEIPVLWMGDDLNLATEAVEGRGYLPVLVFFVPQDCTVEGGTFTVTMSDSLTKLFGNEDAISVYDSNNGVTYILPASLRDLFATARAQTHEYNKTEPADDRASEQSGSASEPASDQADEQETEEPSDDVDGQELIKIHCGEKVRASFSDEDLEWLLDLVMSKLEPQAVNLLISKFPAFNAAAAQQQIGREIGFYVYYKNGDKDGIPEHESAAEALAYVNADSVMKDGALAYCYMIGLDVDDLVALDKDDNPIRNAATGKFSLMRTGKSLETLNNTIVHELFHAFMDDYNRTGMLGAKNLQDGYTPGDKFVNDAQKELFLTLRYPKWFIEGTASAVENVYQYRYDDFQKLREKLDGDRGELADSFTRDALLFYYANLQPSFMLECAPNIGSSSDRAAYSSGYLATLYLSQLAAQKDPTIGSAKNADGSLSSENLRLGLNSILERLHNGETFDAVIKDISTVGNSSPMYVSANDFEKRFIKGVDKGNDEYSGDNASLAFTLDFLNYMLSIEKTPGRVNKPNGSILFDFSADFSEPLDPTKDTTSAFYRIINANTFTPSTVPGTVAFVSGGKSAPNTAMTASEAPMPMAAKAKSGKAADNHATAGQNTVTTVQSTAPRGTTPKTEDPNKDTQVKAALEMAPVIETPRDSNPDAELLETEPAIVAQNEENREAMPCETALTAETPE